MEFVIPAGSAANLPKEMVDKIVDLAVEKSVVLQLTKNRGQMIEVVNEGTIPVLGAEDLDKVYRIDGTSDITTLTEMDFDIQSPDLFPVELGTYITLKKKQVAQYPALKLNELFRNRISRAIARTADKIAIIGDTTIVGSTNPLNISNGIATIAASASLCATTALTYTSSDTQAVLNIVAEARNAIGVYGDAEYAKDLVLFASADFETACRVSANKNYVGFELKPMPELGLSDIVYLHGIPVVKRANITGEKAVLANIMGAFTGYFGKLDVDVEHKAGQRADLLVITYWFDYKWSLINSSGKALGLVEISKTS